MVSELHGSDGNAQIRMQSLPGGTDALSGVRIGEFAGLSKGTYRLLVTLRVGEGRPVIVRPVELELRESFAVTVLITGDCRDLTCPVEAGSALSACLDRQCVDPRCTPETPEHCPTFAGCGQCEGGCFECVRKQCDEVLGICLVTTDDAMCSDGDVCHERLGCYDEATSPYRMATGGSLTLTGPKLVYDQLGERLIRYGGVPDSATSSAATQSWNGETWETICDPCSPGGRIGQGLVYDEVLQRVLLFGGLSHGYQGYSGEERLAYDDLWRLNGNDWQQILPSGSGVPWPPPTAGLYMAYDSRRKLTVMFGGTTGGVPDPSGDALWEYDGEFNSWREVPKTGDSWPSARKSFGSSAAYMRDHPDFGSAFVLHGGNLDAGIRRVDTWAWDGELWTELEAEEDELRHAAALVYEPMQHRLFRMGGYNGLVELSGTAELVQDTDGVSSWAPIHPAPCQIDSSGVAYDGGDASRSSSILLFGGNGRGCGGGNCEDLYLFTPNP